VVLVVVVSAARNDPFAVGLITELKSPINVSLFEIYICGDVIEFSLSRS